MLAVGLHLTWEGTTRASNSIKDSTSRVTRAGLGTCSSTTVNSSSTSNRQWGAMAGTARTLARIKEATMRHQAETIPSLPGPLGSNNSNSLTGTSSLRKKGLFCCSFVLEGAGLTIEEKLQLTLSRFGMGQRLHMNGLSSLFNSNLLFLADCSLYRRWCWMILFWREGLLQ